MKNTDMNKILKRCFGTRFGRDAQWIFSAPGRTELGGNHTDHQRGKVLAAAVNLDIRAAVSPNGENIIRVFSEGYGMCEISLPAGRPQSGEYGSTAALIRGVAAGFSRRGKKIKGFDAYVMSDVLPGSGLSSSAAFEVLIGVIINHMGSCGLTPAQIAVVGQYAENVYFGKPSGLMDQTVCAVGGAVSIDFADPEKPDIRPLHFDFSTCGHSLCIIDSGAGHEDLTGCYAAITRELKDVCAFFGRDVLRDVPEEDFYNNLPQIRKTAGDRAVLRAIHVFDENRRVAAQEAALRRGDFETFLKHVSESGRSSWTLLQNVVPEGRTCAQELAFALAFTEHLLNGRGAVRVHGGGFAGTILTFVPDNMLSDFRHSIEKTLRNGSCHVLSIRPEGGILLENCGEKD